MPEVADLLEEFAAPPAPTRCQCCIALADMSPEQQVKFRAALASPKIPAPRVASVVSGWGYTVSPASVYKHRAFHV